jgi:hypothetical protein
MSLNENMKDFLESLSVEQQRELFDTLENMEQPKEDTPTEIPETSVGEDFTVNRGSIKKGRSPVSGSENTWKDVGELKEVETPSFEKTPRNRPAPKNAEVSCHVCGKAFTVSRSLLYGEFHRCNRCTGK